MIDLSDRRKDRICGRIHPAATAAGILQPLLNQEQHALIEQYSKKMKTDGKPQTTIIPRIRILKQVSQLCNITNPYEVKETLSTLKWKNSTKNNFIMTYTNFLKSIDKTWKKPTYTKEDKKPFIPMEQELDQLIASTGNTMSTLLQMLKETGTRIGEALMLTWLDLNLQQKTVNITPEKRKQLKNTTTIK